MNRVGCLLDASDCGHRQINGLRTEKLSRPFLHSAMESTPRPTIPASFRGNEIKGLAKPDMRSWTR